jgi:hypothetical protein
MCPWTRHLTPIALEKKVCKYHEYIYILVMEQWLRESIQTSWLITHVVTLQLYSSWIYTQYPLLTGLRKCQTLCYEMKLSSCALIYMIFPLIYNLIGVHLWFIQLIGHYWERHTPVYIRSQSWQCMSKQNPSHEIKGILRRALRQDCIDGQIWGRVPKHFCITEGPQEHSGLHNS